MRGDEAGKGEVQRRRGEQGVGKEHGRGGSRGEEGEGTREGKGEGRES